MAVFTLVGAHLAAAGFTGSLTIFGLSPALSSALVGVTRALTLNALASAFTKKGPSLPLPEIQATINQAAAPRRAGYGYNRLGGVRMFFEPINGILHIVTFHHEGAISEVVNYVIDGEIVSLTEQGVTQSVDGSFDFDGLVQIDFRNATISDYAALKAAFPEMWTDDHRLTGAVTTYTRMTAPRPDRIAKVFPKGANTPIQIDANLREVLDTRTGETVYSDNCALCIRDYLVNQDGMRISAESVDDESTSWFANVCDQLVDLKDGTSQKRYRIAGTYGFEDKPRDVVSEMLKACDGQVYLTPEGKIGFIGGVYSEPDVTIGGDDILSITWETGTDPLTDFNVLKGKYTSPDHDFLEQEAPERRNETLLITQPERTDVHEVPWCPDGFQMQRLMKSHEARRRRNVVATVKTNLVGLKARFPKGDGIHTIALENDYLSGVFEVVGHSYSLSAGECEIKLASIYDAWAWDPETEEKELPPKLSDLPQNNPAAPLPENLTLSQEVVEISATIAGVQIVARVDDPGRESLQLALEYQLDGETDWNRMDVSPGAIRGVSGVISEGTYTVRAYWVGQGAAEASYPEEEITVLSNPTIPSPPTLFAANANDQTVTLTWRNAAENFDVTRLFVSTTDSFSGATFVDDVDGLMDQESTYDHEPGIGTYYYWAVTLNASLVSSTAAGSVSVTTTTGS